MTPHPCPCCRGTGKVERGNAEPTDQKGPDGKRVWRRWREHVDCGFCGGKGYVEMWRQPGVRE